MDPTAAVVITDETNYALTDSFSISHVVLQNHYDLVFDWSQLTVDFFGKTVNPSADINTVSISLWNLTPSEIEEALKVDNLPLTSNSGVITTFPDGSYTHMNLTGFNELGNPLPIDELWSRFDVTTPNYQYPQDQYTFLVMAQSGADVGKKPHSVALFNLDTTSTTTQLNLENDSTKLMYTVDLEKAHPMLVPAGVPAVTIDWSQMTLHREVAPRSAEPVPEPRGHRRRLVVGRAASRANDRSQHADRQERGGVPRHRRQWRLDGRPLLRQLQQPGALVDHDSPAV
jgi:hypothetical protein